MNETLTNDDVTFEQPGPDLSNYCYVIVNFLGPNTVQWLEHLLDHKNQFETGVVRANECDESARSGGKIRISLVSNNMKVCCVFSLESPQKGDSNEYTQYTIFNIRKENHHKLSQICSYGIFSKALKNKFETAVVNEPSVFEPLKFCNLFLYIRILTWRYRGLTISPYLTGWHSVRKELDI